MKKIVLSEEIREAAPALRVIHIEANVVNGPTQEELWSQIERLGSELAGIMEIPDIARRPGIAATRAAYKACGKDPNRYRPSQEALNRRVLQGKGLYRITALVDVVNLLSLWSGYSIGGFDADKIDGDTLTLGIGRHEEPYRGIGRGELNIEGLPVYRDATGGIGTPTSDNERTMIDDNTRRLLMTVNVYGEEVSDEDFISQATLLLTRYAGAEDIEVETVR